MPAMSPTMETGAIVAWKVKAGEPFSSGDQLLDVETDKATISVDAIDDGIMAKILLPDGAKDVPVGTPIAITADPEDDLATLAMPILDATPEPVAAAPEPPIAPAEKKSETKPATPTSINAAQVFFPSVDLLLHKNGISREIALNEINATGPHGRILKGDVLAYLGKIPQEENSSIAKYIETHTHLDLSHIELRAEAPKAETINDQAPNTVEDKSVSKPKKEPVVVSREFVFEQEPKSLAKIIRAAEMVAYTPIESKSDLDDPLFDDIIAPSVDRFTINYRLDKSILTFDLTLNDKAFDATDKASVFFKEIERALAL